MATSGNIDKKITSWLTLRLKWVANSQSVANNKTNVTVTAQLISSASSGNINSSAAKDIELKINGASYKTTCTVGLSGGATKTLFTKTVDVAHNADGTKSCSLSCTLGIDVTLSGTWYGDQTVSGTATFNTIPRASTYGTVTGNTIGDTMTVNITRNSSSFTHQLSYRVRASDWYDVGSGIGTSKSFTINKETCSQFPSATSGTLQLRLRTYNGSTQIGSDTYKNITVYVPSSVVPSVSAFTLSEAVSSIKGKFSGFVNKQSKIAYSVTAAGSYGSTIKSYSVSIAGQKFSKSSGTTAAISASAGTNTATVTVTDSRGRKATKNTTFSVYAYSPPAFKSITAKRCNSDGTLNEDGECLQFSVNVSVSAVNNQNTASYALSYKQTTASSYTAITYSASGYSVNKSVTITSPTFSIDKTYNIRFEVTDSFTKAAKVLTLSSAKPILDIKADGSGIAFNKVAELSGVSDFGSQARFSGGISPIALEPSTDLNDILTPNFYYCKDGGNATYKNTPLVNNDTITFILEVKQGGNNGITQILTTTSKDNVTIFQRAHHSSAWGDWNTIYSNDGRLLWSGALQMTDTETITLSEQVKAQPIGVVLVFSACDNGVSQNYDFQDIFVSKYSVATHGSSVRSFVLGSVGFWQIGCKALKVGNTQITGDSRNDDAGTANGITYNNKGYCLRYVIGV